MKKAKLMLQFVFVIIIYHLTLALVSIPAHADIYSFTTIDCPSSLDNITFIYSINGNKIAGTARSQYNCNMGFSYNGKTYGIFSLPNPSRPYDPVDTSAYGIYGNHIVGEYISNDSCWHGYLYDGNTFTSIDHPDATQTRAFGICGNNIVGSYYVDGDRWHGFLYDGNNFTTIDPPGTDANGVQAYAIDGNNIVGTYFKNGYPSSFLYDGTSYIDLPNFPRDTVPWGARSTEARGIKGSNIVGHYFDEYFNSHAHGFLYDGKNFISIDYPGATDTFPCGIDDKGNIVGYYYDNTSGGVHGFIACPGASPLTSISIQPFLNLLLD